MLLFITSFSDKPELEKGFQHRSALIRSIFAVTRNIQHIHVPLFKISVSAHVRSIDEIPLLSPTSRKSL